MKLFGGVVILGVGVLLCSGSIARAQLGDMENSLKKGADEAVQQGVKGAEQKAGLAVPDATVTPGAAAPAAGAPAGADTPAGAPGAGGGAPNAPDGD